MLSSPLLRVCLFAHIHRFNETYDFFFEKVDLDIGCVNLLYSDSIYILVITLVIKTIIFTLI